MQNNQPQRLKPKSKYRDQYYYQMLLLGIFSFSVAVSIFTSWWLFELLAFASGIPFGLMILYELNKSETG